MSGDAETSKFAWIQSRNGNRCTTKRGEPSATASTIATPKAWDLKEAQKKYEDVVVKRRFQENRLHYFNERPRRRFLRSRNALIKVGRGLLSEREQLCFRTFLPCRIDS
jgi:hypothetical protein